MNPLGKYEYEVELSMMEIYNEEVIDLLPSSHHRHTTTKIASRQGEKKLEVVCATGHDDDQPRVVVRGLTSR